MSANLSASKSAPGGVPSVVLHAPEAFSAATDAAKLALHNIRLRQATLCTADGTDGKIRRLNNLSKLWIPHSKALILSGVALDGEIIRGSPHMKIALGRAWQPTFDAKPFDATRARAFLDSVEGMASFDNPAPPYILYLC